MNILTFHGGPFDGHQHEMSVDIEPPASMVLTVADHVGGFTETLEWSHVERYTYAHTPELGEWSYTYV